MRTVHRNIATNIKEYKAADRGNLVGFPDYYRRETQRTIYLVY